MFLVLVCLNCLVVSFGVLPTGFLNNLLRVPTGLGLLRTNLLDVVFQPGNQPQQDDPTTHSAISRAGNFSLTGLSFGMNKVTDNRGKLSKSDHEPGVGSSENTDQILIEPGKTSDLSMYDKHKNN